MQRVEITSYELIALISCLGGEPKLYPITTLTAFDSHQMMLLTADDIAKRETSRTGMEHRVIGVRIEMKGNVNVKSSGNFSGKRMI